MNNIKISPPIILLGAAVLAVLDWLMMLLGAVMVERGTLVFDGTEIWGILSLVVSSTLTGAICLRKNRMQLHTYLSAALYFLIVCFSLWVTEGVNVPLSACAKGITALGCGSFLGNLLGRFLYHRSVSDSKKKRSYSK